MALLQWNCRGLSSNRSDIDQLVLQYNPVAICLQETFVHRPVYPFRGYIDYHHYSDVDVQGRPHGGVSIMMSSKVPQHEIQLNTTLKAVAVRITVHKPITVCSIYISPRGSFAIGELDHLITQLPTPFVILGDFNAHNTIWGGDTTDSRGRSIEDFLANNNLCIWNDERPTYNIYIQVPGPKLL